MRSSCLFAAVLVAFPLFSDAPKAVALQKQQTNGLVVNGLQLTLTAASTEVKFKDGKLSEPVSFKLTFTNFSDKPLKFNAYDFDWSRIKAEVKSVPADAVTTQRAAADRKLPSPAAGDFFELKPGQTWSPGSRLAFPGFLPESVGSKVQYQIVKTGEFRIRFRYASDKIDNPLADGIWTGELLSNEVVITVKK